MKKVCIISILLILANVRTEAQNMQIFTEMFDSITENISRVDATTGILYERVLPFSNLKQFSNSNPDTAIYQLNISVFLQKNKFITYKT